MKIEVTVLESAGVLTDSFFAWAEPTYGEGVSQEVTTSRHETPKEAYETVLKLAEKLWGACEVVELNRETKPEYIENEIKQMEG